MYTARDVSVQVHRLIRVDYIELVTEEITLTFRRWMLSYIIQRFVNE